MYTKLLFYITKNIKNWIQQWKKSKFSWITIMVIAVGATIGAGIFFKNGSIFKNSQHNVDMAVASWVIAGMGVLAIGLALIELSKANTKSSEGPLAWTNTYAWRWVKKSARSYMYWIYLPVTMFAMPLYFVMSIQDGTNIELNGWAIVGISLAIAIFFIVLTGLSTKISADLQWIITIFKLFPIIAVIVLGFQSDAPTEVQKAVAKGVPVDNGSGISAKIAFLGVFASLPAILFAYDGFYMASTLSQDMKKPKQLPMALFLSIIIITGAYVLITVAVGDRGSIFGLDLSDKWLKIINISIAVAILGIINGFAIGIPKMLDEAIANDEIIGSSKMKKLGKNGGWIFALIITLVIFIIFTPIGLYGFKNTNEYEYLGKGANELYNSADFLTNWTSLLIFVYIGLAILGASVKWWKNGTIKSKGIVFIISSIISVLLLAIALIYYLADSIYIAVNDGTAANWMLVVIPFMFIIASVLLELKVKGREDEVHPENSIEAVEGLAASQN